MQVESSNSIYENHSNITTYEQGTLTHFRSMLYFNIPSKYQETGAVY